MATVVLKTSISHSGLSGIRSKDTWLDACKYDAESVADLSLAPNDTTSLQTQNGYESIKVLVAVKGNEPIQCDLIIGQVGASVSIQFIISGNMVLPIKDLQNITLTNIGILDAPVRMSLLQKEQ